MAKDVTSNLRCILLQVLFYLQLLINQDIQKIKIRQCFEKKLLNAVDGGLNFFVFLALAMCYIGLE